MRQMILDELFFLDLEWEMIALAELERIEERIRYYKNIEKKNKRLTNGSAPFFTPC